MNNQPNHDNKSAKNLQSAKRITNLLNLAENLLKLQQCSARAANKGLPIGRALDAGVLQMNAYESMRRRCLFMLGCARERKWELCATA